MSLEQALRIFLLGKPQITALVGQRIHIGDFVPLQASDLPAICFESDPQPRVQQIDGAECQMQFPQFDIICHAREFAQSRAIGDLVCAAFRAIPLGAMISLAPGTVLIQEGDQTAVGNNTGWSIELQGKGIEMRDINGRLIYLGAITQVDSLTVVKIDPAPDFTDLEPIQMPLQWRIIGASPVVQIVEVDILSAWNEKEEEVGHGLTSKPRAVKIRVGWLEDTAAI